MRRREFITLLGRASAAWPLQRARAQKAPIRIGLLASGAAASANSATVIYTIKQGLRDNGLVEGQDYVLEARFAAGDYERFPEMAHELAKAGARVLLVHTVASTRAAQNVSPPVAVVMLSVNDPLGMGLVASLARPGGNTTGMASLNEDITSKLLDIEHKVVPNAKNIAALFNPANPTNPVFLDDFQTAANAIGITVLPIELRLRETLDAAFSTIAARHPDFLYIVADSAIWDLNDRIATFALAQGLPSLTSLPNYAKLGGLMNYAAFPFRRACYFVKRILDGANPGDLPVEVPTRADLVINLKTARTLGLTIPPGVLAIADEVIE
jgi:putative ABC transport system substrate-binding protein